NNTGYDLLGAYRPAGSSGVRLGSTMWQYLSLNNNPDGSGIVDPRTYIWYLKNKDGQWLPYPQDNPSSALPDDADVYLTLDNIANPPSVYSPINLNLLNQNNDIPRPILSVAEVKFLLAEAYLRGIGVAKDPAKSEQYYYDGIRSSINYWFSWVNKSGAWVNKPATPTDAAINTLLAAPMVVFTGDDVTKLRRIYAQEWLSMFWQPDMAFYLMRRTNMTPHSGTPYDASFYRLKYPPAEAAYNKANYNAAVATLGQDDTGKKLWWMK
ncbi:MAG TPA: SusD/RagB family nutrient-binding outer membrane lipoprotein, partial [Chitinophaga sp.]